MPKRMMYYLENINRCTPDLPKELLLDEKTVIDKKETSRLIKEGLEIPRTMGIMDTYNNMS
jgi:hypothetical protein